jgi:hypothetical protein
LIVAQLCFFETCLSLGKIWSVELANDSSIFSFLCLVSNLNFYLIYHLFDTIDLFDHLALIFLCWLILIIKMVITHRWWLINCRLSISNIVWTNISRKRRRIQIIIPWM